MIALIEYPTNSSAFTEIGPTKTLIAAIVETQLRYFDIMRTINTIIQ